MINRHFTTGEDPLAAVNWARRSATIVSKTGEVVFQQDDVEVPASWSPLATNVVASKYFRGNLGTPERESSVRQMISRVVDAITQSGIEQDYFNPTDAAVFHDELAYVLVHQLGTFNSPVWFNVGAMEHPQSSACFVLSVEDDMRSILELACTEAMIFKSGSGTGVNLSPLRGSMEHLSGGGQASGPVSFMKGFDAFTGAIKSGGRTRRAAKLVVLNADHPDVLEFIWCKAREEKKAHALIDAGYDDSIDGEAYGTVAFQNANNSVRVTDAFMEKAVNGETWDTIARTTGKVVNSYNARDLLTQIAQSVYQCGDPALQFDTMCNRWNTCKASGRINAANACTEVQFLDNSACNLASINLLKFLDPCGFNIKSFVHVVDLFILAQDILVDMSSYPTQVIEENSHRFRPLGLGYSNLGALLMAMGLPYDSEEGRNAAAAITSLMTARAYAASGLLAQCRGSFEGYVQNRESMLEVLNLHRHAADRLWDKFDDDGDQARPRQDYASRDLVSKVALEARICWSATRDMEEVGFRNAQVTLLAPTGTISFMMDCDTTGIEPSFSLVTVKNLVGGGVMKIHNSAVALALMKLGYSEEEQKKILAHVVERGVVEGSVLKAEHLSVFDCAGKIEGRFISPIGHVLMVAAVQPFLSGAISKTVNVPEETTPDEIRELFVVAWQLGVKAVAIYRDHSKRSQPLETKRVERPAPAAQRHRLPDERKSVTHKFSIAGHEGYVTVGMYDDGTPGELFIRMAKAGSVVAGMMDAFALSISLALQYGVPLQVLVDKYSHSRFEPSGFTTNPQIPIAKSITDYIFRWLGMKFLAEEATAPAEAPATVESDAPVCLECGGWMTRSGTCYRCMSCGSSSGCG